MEWYYRHINNLSENEINSDDDRAHYNFDNIQPLLNFLNNQLLPALTNEPEVGMVSNVYGGEQNYNDLFNNSTNYVGKFALFEDEISDYYTSAVKNCWT